MFIFFMSFSYVEEDEPTTAAVLLAAAIVATVCAAISASIEIPITVCNC
jgi:hypothetical protein